MIEDIPLAVYIADRAVVVPAGIIGPAVDDRAAVFERAGWRLADCIIKPARFPGRVYQVIRIAYLAGRTCLKKVRRSVSRRYYVFSDRAGQDLIHVFRVYLGHVRPLEPPVNIDPAVTVDQDARIDENSPVHIILVHGRNAVLRK